MFDRLHAVLHRAVLRAATVSHHHDVGRGRQLVGGDGENAGDADHERRDETPECDPMPQDAVEETRAFLGRQGGRGIGQWPEGIGVGQLSQEGVVAIGEQIQFQRYHETGHQADHQGQQYHENRAYEGREGGGMCRDSHHAQKVKACDCPDNECGEESKKQR